MLNKKKIINFVIVLILTVLVLYFSLKDNFYEVINQMKDMNLVWIFVAFLLMLSYFFFRSAVNMCLARKFNKQYRFRQAFRMELEIAFFNAITPFSTGGKPYEIYSLKKNNLKVVDASNVAIQNFIVYQFALIILGLFALTYNNIFHVLENNNLLVNLVYIGFFVNSAVIVFLFVVSFAKKMNKSILKSLIRVLDKFKLIKNKDSISNNLEHHLVEFHKGAKVLLSNKLEFIGLVCLQIISLVSLYLIPAIILYAMYNYSSVTGLTSIIVSAYVMLIGSFVPMPGGTGGLEYVFMVFFGGFISGPSLNLMMLVWRFITYYFGFILGAIAFNIRKDKKI